MKDKVYFEFKFIEFLKKFILSTSSYRVLAKESVTAKYTIP